MEPCITIAVGRVAWNRKIKPTRITAAATTMLRPVLLLAIRAESTSDAYTHEAANGASGSCGNQPETPCLVPEKATERRVIKVI